MRGRLRNLKQWGTAKTLAMLQRHILARRFRLVVVTGLKRSGNHVFINWLMAQSPGHCLFRKHIARQCYPLRGGWPEMRLVGSIGMPSFVFSYEDRAKEDILRGGLADFISDHGERIVEQHLCIALRDPRHLMASRFRKWPEERADSGRSDATLALWRAHLDTARHGGAVAGFNVVPVWYSSFVDDPDWRDELADRLRIRRGTRGLGTIPHQGHGSSFGETGATPGEGVSERWRAYADDPAFARLFADGGLDEETARAARDLGSGAVVSTETSQ